MISRLGLFRLRHYGKAGGTYSPLPGDQTTVAIQFERHSTRADPQPIAVDVTDQDGVTVCSLTGCAEPSDLNRLAGTVSELRRSRRHVVLDLDGLTLTHPDAVAGFFARLGTASSPLVLCCARLSGRRLLRRCGAGRVGAVVPTIPDALRLLNPEV